MFNVSKVVAVVSTVSAIVFALLWLNAKDDADFEMERYANLNERLQSLSAENDQLKDQLSGV